ncbi:[SSU ribosomal protein S18P]-alanine acetyltransferase [Hathewaya proteolytica DSM 3090]|uniref:[Ribosomal protein bS18]-alanine N-acetyltransferase n=1 Tax=Hathewaya proteolytica DSM 3090 TaxID=1121331 RepID=A0A1M6RMV3_9CLOT|nr:ribosomal protein S18-alanine N-acetyltransferase [Hathewaya proteolytica]SHK33785.1 [SSU ribosomal protein S18P]-alanine acetyltransferase [Hathewaya proteolytica DSM 3090]
MHNIEYMTDKDINDVYNINLQSLKNPWSMESLKSELHNNKAKYVVCKDQSGTVLGFGGMWIIYGEGNVTNIAVAKEARRCGVGTKILNSLVSICKGEGADAMTLEVRESNTAAISLYEKSGFVSCGLRKNFYSNPIENAVIMWNYNINSME